jgi:hypothetical protein
MEKEKKKKREEKRKMREKAAGDIDFILVPLLQPHNFIL